VLSFENFQPDTLQGQEALLVPEFFSNIAIKNKQIEVLKLFMVMNVAARSNQALTATQEA